MYCAYVTTIKELWKHSNADRLQCTTIFGNHVIVDMSYQVGDRIIYFPVDGQLSEKFARENHLVREMDQDGKNIGGYLDPEKRNITALKLRGEKSDGLVLPLEVLAKYTDISKLSDGTPVTELNGEEICRKYISRGKTPLPESSAGTENQTEERETVSWPFFAQHIETEQLAFHQQDFRKGDTIYLTQKLHGTSFRVSNALEVTVRRRPAWAKKWFHMKDKEQRRYSMISGTRRVTLDSGFRGANEFRGKYLALFEGKLPKGMTVFGEIVGWMDETRPIMPKCANSKVKDKEFTRLYGPETVFTYGCEPGENKCYIYRITMTNEDGVVVELPTEETLLWCERLGVDYVPLLDKFLYTDWEDLNRRCESYLDVPEPLAGGRHVTREWWCGLTTGALLLLSRQSPGRSRSWRVSSRTVRSLRTWRRPRS